MMTTGAGTQSRPNRLSAASERHRHTGPRSVAHGKPTQVTPN